MWKAICIAVVSIGVSARATIYVAAYDPATRAIGYAYSSSGANFWQTKVKGKGLIGAQAYGLCSEATPEKWLREGLSAQGVADELTRQCRQAGWEKFRLVAITADGAIAGVIAKQGCHRQNEVCGEIKSRDFIVIGGGLEANVLEAARDFNDALPSETSLPCRLYRTLREVYRAGGEKKDFRGASVTVDFPSRSKLMHWEARGAEGTLLETIHNQMHQEGHVCH